jgi:hypothetical protein
MDKFRDFNILISFWTTENSIFIKTKLILHILFSVSHDKCKDFTVLEIVF